MAENHNAARLLGMQKSQLEVSLSDEKTMLIVLAVHNDPARNVVNRISVKHGIPLGGYVCESNKKAEVYLYECSDYLHLGLVPVSLRLRLKNSSWSVRMPACESVLKRHLSEEQKRDLRVFKARHKDHTFETLQLIDPC